jgi:hypothetical protein
MGLWGGLPLNRRLRVRRCNDESPAATAGLSPDPRKVAVPRCYFLPASLSGSEGTKSTGASTKLCAVPEASCRGSIRNANH